MHRPSPATRGREGAGAAKAPTYPVGLNLGKISFLEMRYFREYATF
jgi:hypothetical protein